MLHIMRLKGNDIHIFKILFHGKKRVSPTFTEERTIALTCEKSEIWILHHSRARPKKFKFIWIKTASAAGSLTFKTAQE